MDIDRVSHLVTQHKPSPRARAGLDNIHVGMSGCGTGRPLLWNWNALGFGTQHMREVIAVSSPTSFFMTTARIEMLDATSCKRFPESLARPVSLSIIGPKDASFHFPQRHGTGWQQLGNGTLHSKDVLFDEATEAHRITNRGNCLNPV